MRDDVPGSPACGVAFAVGGALLVAVGSSRLHQPTAWDGLISVLGGAAAILFGVWLVFPVRLARRARPAIAALAGDSEARRRDHRPAHRPEPRPRRRPGRPGARQRGIA